MSREFILNIIVVFMIQLILLFAVSAILLIAPEKVKSYEIIGWTLLACGIISFVLLYIVIHLSGKLMFYESRIEAVLKGRTALSGDLFKNEKDRKKIN